MNLHQHKADYNNKIKLNHIKVNFVLFFLQSVLSNAGHKRELDSQT